MAEHPTLSSGSTPGATSAPPTYNIHSQPPHIIAATIKSLQWTPSSPSQWPIPPWIPNLITIPKNKNLPLWRTRGAVRSIDGRSLATNWKIKLYIYPQSKSQPIPNRFPLGPVSLIPQNEPNTRRQSVTLPNSKEHTSTTQPIPSFSPNMPLPQPPPSQIGV